MGARRWIGRAALASVAALLAWPGTGAEPGTARERLRASGTPVGAGRCSAAACHGSAVPQGGGPILGDEHTAWIDRDPHANATRTLDSTASRALAVSLGRRSGRVIPPASDARCLACHATVAVGASLSRAATALVRDGVGCESCHGAAGRWLGPHSAYGWDGRSPRDKEERYGLTDTKDLARRAEVCAGCHVGSPGRAVDHDLIAAGHPALQFEFSAYLANLPAHWREKGRNRADDLPARAWAIGQAVAARASLEQLATRAQAARVDPGHWPEFSEFACASCHRTLGGSARLATTPASGTPAWGTWYQSLTGVLARTCPGPGPREYEARVGALRASLAAPLPAPDAVAARADEAARALTRWLATLDAEPFGPARVSVLIAAVEAAGPTPGRDADVQRYLALIPLRQALPPPMRDRPSLLRALDDLDRTLGIPHGGPPARDAISWTPAGRRD